MDSFAPRRHQTDAGRGDENLITLAAVHDLGIARDQQDAGFVTGGPHGRDDAPEVGERQALLQDERGGKVKGPGSADREVVDGAVNRQPADVAAGKKDRPHDKRIRGEGDAGSVTLSVKRRNSNF